MFLILVVIALVFGIVAAFSDTARAPMFLSLGIVFLALALLLNHLPVR